MKSSSNGSAVCWNIWDCFRYFLQLPMQNSLYTDAPPPSLRKKSGEETTVNRRTVVNRVPVSPECWGKPLIGCNVNAMTQIISGVVIGE